MTVKIEKRKSVQLDPQFGIRKIHVHQLANFKSTALLYGLQLTDQLIKCTIITTVTDI